jgi:hypothetical protein
METYSRIGLLRSHENLRSYWTTTKLRKPTLVLDCYEAMETYSRIGLLRSYGNLQSYWTTTKLRKLTVVLKLFLPVPAQPQDPLFFDLVERTVFYFAEICLKNQKTYIDMMNQFLGQKLEFRILYNKPRPETYSRIVISNIN